MRKLIILSSIILWIFSCQSMQPENKFEEVSAVSNPEPLHTGAERLEVYLNRLKHKRIALVVNQTSMLGATHLVDTFMALGLDIRKVFAPEHGFRGDHADGAHIKNDVDPRTGIKVLSLYGKTRKPNKEMLADVDVVIFDIQDVGVRFYTFISTMHYIMEACAENGLECVVLDRPNPNGFYVDGPVLDLKYRSFIGMHPIPVVHGLTVGELALMINGEKWLENGMQCDLTVIPCKGYNHDLKYELPVRPSPNLPNMNAVYLYPFLGLFEGTNVSVGRGTDKPFQLIGRPGYKGEIQFTPMSIPGISDHPKYEGVACSGMMIEDVVRGEQLFNPRLNLSYLLEFYRTNRSDDAPFFKETFDKLAGSERLRTQIVAGFTEDQIRESWTEELSSYRELRKKYLLYP